MLLKNVLQERRSIRIFSDCKVERSVLANLIDMARWAPSHCNLQESRFIVIDDEQILRQLVQHGGSAVMQNGKQGILVLFKNVSDNVDYHPQYQSGAAAIQNLCLYAHSLGLATCWLIHLPRQAVIRKILKIPKIYAIVALVMVGYPAQPPAVVPRRYALEEIIAYNTFTLSRTPEHKPCIRRLGRRFYFLLPVLIKKLIRGWVDRNFVKKFPN